jgi:LysM repeat protein
VLFFPVPADPGPSATLRPASEEIQVLSRLTIKKGDTLWKLSKQTFGKGAYYPQLLAYNSVQDPDKIYAGKTLLLPEGTLNRHPELATRLAGKTATVVFPAPPASPSAASPGGPPPAASPAPAPRAANEEESEVRMIIEWAQQEKCGKVIAAADRFLSRYPESSRLVTVLWHQAECYRLMARSSR